MSVADENLVIYAYTDIDDPRSGKLFSIPHSVYTDPKYAVTGAAAATPMMLLSMGTVAANMTNDGTGTGGFCYLLNVPALRPPTVDPTSLKETTEGAARSAQNLSPRELVGAIRALIDEARSGKADESQEALKQLRDEVNDLP